MKVHVFDFRWKDPQTVLFQASAQGRLGQKFMNIGDKLSLKVESDIRCAGSMFEGQWMACDQAGLDRAKCDLCRRRERAFVFTVFDGFDTSNLSDQDLERIAGEHVVYLAYFDEDFMKVGVSKKERGTLRQLEQGSYASLFIAQTPDGTRARQIETLIKRAGMMDKIKKSQKKDRLFLQISEKEVEERLRLAFEKMSPAITQTELKTYLLDPAEFTCWEKTYHTPDVQASSKPHHHVELQIGESVSGTLRAVKGQFLILETENEMVSICGKDLNGRMVDFADSPPGLKLEKALQNSLF